MSSTRQCCKKIWLPALIAVIAIGFAIHGRAEVKAEVIYDLTHQVSIELSQLVKKVEPGSVVIVSEYHDQVAHHEHQIAFLTELKNQNNHQTGIAVGMEFFSYPHQPQVNLYLQNQLAENDFLKAIGWGNNPFDFYRHQVLFPRQAGGWTQALNAPPWLSRKIAKEGLLSLTEEEKTFLPPQFQLGRPLYYQRFVDAMGGGHIPEEAMQRYFVAQSLWDDTMAWQAANYLSHNPDHVLVIIVGDFHATYGGGLPDRLNARGIHKVLTVSQTTLQDYTPEERERLLEPDVKYGQRADFLWTTEGNSSKSLPGQRPYQSIVRRLLWQ